MSGAQVPDEPPYPYGEFKSLHFWWRYFKGSVVQSAHRAGALEAKACGPRGGTWFAATHFWIEWARNYRERSRKRAETAAANEAERLLTPPVYCSACKWWVSPATGSVFSCHRPGRGARRSAFRRERLVCHKFFEPREITPLSDDLRRGGL